MKFKLKANYKPTGDQPQAIDKLTNNYLKGIEHQVLLGVTGSGKTYTMANVIQNTQKPTLLISHNKTLAAQLYQEFKEFFPENAVSYFVSYYDYYQPEAYIPQTDTYIAKETDINQEIDKLRLQATSDIFSTIVSSVNLINMEIQEISAATEEMSASTDQLVDNVTEVASIAQQTAANSREVSDLSEKQEHSLNAMINEIESLNTYVENVQKVVNTFKI